jgi:hypothetical protein
MRPFVERSHSQGVVFGHWEQGYGHLRQLPPSADEIIKLQCTLHRTSTMSDAEGADLIAELYISFPAQAQHEGPGAVAPSPLGGEDDQKGRSSSGSPIGGAWKSS